MPAPKTAPLGPSWGTATSRQGRGAERVPSVRGRRVLPHSRLSACWSTFSSWRQERPPTWHRAGAPLAACSAGIPIALRAPTLASSGLGSGLLPPRSSSCYARSRVRGHSCSCGTDPDSLPWAVSAARPPPPAFRSLHPHSQGPCAAPVVRILAASSGAQRPLHPAPCASLSPCGGSTMPPKFSRS